MATKKKVEKEEKNETETTETKVEAPVADNEQLATVGPQGLQDKSLSPHPMGFDGFTEDDLIIPRIVITQKSGDAVDAGFTVGKLRSNISDQEWESIRCTPLLYKKGMVLFDKPYRRGAKPLCKSNDAMVPSPAVAKPVSPVCHKLVRRRLVPVCPKAKWTEDAKGNKVPPECNLCHNTVFRQDDTGMGFFFQFRSSAINTWKKYLSLCWSMKRNLFSMSMVLSSEDKTNQFGTFKIPRISDLESHDTEEEKELAEVYHGFQEMDLDASFDDERNLEDDGGEIQDAGDASFNPDEMAGEKF